MKALVFDLSGITEQDSTAEPVVRIEEIKRDAVEPVERGGVTVTAGIDAGGDVTMMNYQDWLKWGERFEAANARIAELEARNIELEQRLCIMVERGENREAQLADAHREIERSHEIIVGQNEEIVKAKAERDEANARAEAAEAALTIARERCHFWGMQASEREEWLRKAESRAADLANVLTKVEAYMASEGGPLYRLWENCDIGDYDYGQTEWEQTLFDVRDWKNGCVPAASVGGGTEWPEVLLYREVLKALDPGTREEGEAK